MPDEITFEDLLSSYSDEIFIGREEHISIFERNITSLNPRFYVLSVFGQSGVGKSTLLDKLSRIAADYQYLTIRAGKIEKTPIKILESFAEQLEETGYNLKVFTGKFQKYQELKKQVEADPAAPGDLFDASVRGFTRAGLSVLKHNIPVVGEIASEFLSGEVEQKVVDEASKLKRYIVQKFSNKEDQLLLLETDQELSRYFIADINKLAETRKVVFFFDNFEESSPSLGEWLREFIKKSNPKAVQFVIVGKFPLGKEWVAYRKLIHQIELRRFTEQEAREFLLLSGKTDENEIVKLIKLSECLPIWLSFLVFMSGTGSAEFSETAVEYVLDGISSQQKEIALVISIARYFNQDILNTVLGPDVALDAFNWLRKASFVRVSSNAWSYHELPRTKMVHYFYLRSREMWVKVHEKLANYYHKLEDETANSDKQKYISDKWHQYRTERLYHLLSLNPSKNFIEVIRSLLYDFKTFVMPDTLSVSNVELIQYIKDYSHLVSQVANETEDSYLATWDYRFKKIPNVENCRSFKAEPEVIDFFLAITKISELSLVERSIVFCLYGQIIDVPGKEEEALSYFNKAIMLDPFNEVAPQKSVVNGTTFR